MRGAFVSCVAAVLAAFPAFAADRAYAVTGGPYAIDGTTQPILTLVRGKSYQFNAGSVSSLHPFKLTTSSSGGSATPIYTNQVAGAQPVCGSGCSGSSFVFAPDSSTPDTLYYQCNIHPNLGNLIRIVDPPRMTSLMLTGGLIGITFTNAYGTTATVQRATDLFSNTWVTIQTITAAPGVASLIVTNLPPLQHLRATTPLP